MSSSSTTGMEVEVASLALAAPKRPPAKTYKFTLDPFQQTAVNHIENNESVLVAAHTSAGKTAIAEYAIATSLRDKQRVIYTSPIKALSNQKFRDLQAEFSDVGLMTGDVTIDPNASCLVMTTEILRSMLYRGSEVMREVAWVVFDEVHYLRDSERGVVWEESIILLPHKVRFVFLSATIPNAAEFAKWVESVHHQPCHVVYTDYRPTPLQHYLYCSGSEGMFLVVDEKGRFNEKNFQSAMAVLGPSDAPEGGDSGGGDGEGDGNSRAKKKPRRGGKAMDLERIIRMIIDKKYDPVIVFSFSKKECETYALQISRTDLTGPDEKRLINKIFENAVDSLSEDDRKLPQVQSLLPLLRRGIGIHHGGLLPILKEIVEIMFGEGLLKCLFATETFAMGINMPAKTVVFTAHRKFDGAVNRVVRSGEYIQMSGRAGRRGLDDRGIVILMVDEKMDMEQAKGMMSGKADPLTSSFYLGYNMVLNLMRVEDADPEFIVKNSFFVFQREQAIPDLVAKQQELLTKAQEIHIDSKDLVIQYHRLVSQANQIEKQIRGITRNVSVLRKFLSSAGRLVFIDGGWGWGVVVGGIRVLEEESQQQSDDQHQQQPEFQPATVDVLLCCNPTNLAKDEPAPMNSDCDFRVVAVSLSSISKLSSIVITVPKELKTPNGRKQALKLMREVMRRFESSGGGGAAGNNNGTIPLLDNKKDLKLDKDDRLSTLEERFQELEAMIAQHPMHMDVRRDVLLKRRAEQLQLEMEASKVEKQVKQIKTLPLKEELRRMKTVLRRLGYTDKDDVVQLKGRVACEISTSDELLVCELLLGGTFNELDPAVCAALCSCLVFEEGGSDKEETKTIIGSLKPELQQPFKQLQSFAKRIAEVQSEADVPVDVQEYVDKFRPDLMEVVLLWCRGSKFKDICDVTSVFEGSIVRSVRREVELMRQLCTACKVIGDENLEKKFTRAVELMQRDIMFAASLYL